MPHPIVATVKILGVNPVDVPHPLGEIALKRFHHQVVMVGHKAIGMTEPVEPFDCLSENGQEPLSVLVVFKYRQPGIPPRSNMIECTRKFQSKWSRHFEDNITGKLIIQDLTPLSDNLIDMTERT